MEFLDTSSAFRATSYLCVRRPRTGGEIEDMSKTIKKATGVLVMSARLYRELALSALELIPGRREP